MNEELVKKLNEQDGKLDAIYESVEKTRRYFFWTLVITLLAVVLPLIGLSVLLPAFLSSFGTL